MVEQTAAGERFDKWLADGRRLQSRSRASRALLHGQVFVNDREQTMADGARRLESGDRVRIWIDRPRSASRQGPHKAGNLDVVFEDDDLIVLDKPAGLLTVPLPEQPRAESLAARVHTYWHSHGRAPLAVHRLDRDTSGLVVFARTPLARGRLKRQFIQRTPERRYLAVVSGVPAGKSGEWRTWLRWDSRARRQLPVAPDALHAFEAVSRFAVLDTFASVNAALIEVWLTTGKRHQIRVQAWLHGHALVGERMYVGPPHETGASILFDRQALHAYRLGFIHPRTEEALVFERHPPDDLRTLMDRLRRRQRAASRTQGALR